MSKETAYRSADPEVVAAWHEYEAEYKAISEKRAALEDALGRKMWVQRSGLGTSRIVGFERFDSDKDGDLVHHDGCLIVSSKRGYHGGRVVPNLRRKAGKEFERELRALSMPKIDLSGMPQFHLYGDGDTVGIRSASPALWMHDGIVYALWPCDNAPVKDNWETIPLSTYYLAHEQHEKEKADADQG